MGKRRRWPLAAVLLLMPALPACSLVKTRSFTNPKADFSFYKKVGILPFKNESDDQLAGEKVTEFFMTEVLIAGQLQVMDPGQFNAVIAEVARSNAPTSTIELSPQQLSQVAAAAKVEGILKGTVHDYKMMQLGGEQYPMIALTVKLIDAPTGTVAWQMSVSAQGGPFLPIVAFGETFTLAKLAQEVCRDIVKDLHKPYAK